MCVYIYIYMVSGESRIKPVPHKPFPHTVFDLITAPALITALLTFYFTFTYYCPLDNLFPDFLL